MTNCKDKSTEEVLYMDHRAPLITQAWSKEGRRFDYDAQRFIPRTASPDVDVVTESFKRAQFRYLQTSEALPKGVYFDSNTTHTWDDVVGMVKAAVEKYEKKGKGFQGLFRKAGIAMANSKTQVTAWIGLLPSGDYGSVVSGAVKLVLSASSRMNEVRITILGALEKLPESLEVPEQYLTLYKGDLDLVRAVEVFYIRLLEALESMLKWLEHKTTLHVLQAVGQPGDYEKVTRTRIEAMHAAAERFSKQVEYCFQSRVKRIEANTSQVVQNLQTYGNQLKSLNVLLEAGCDASEQQFLLLREIRSIVEWSREMQEVTEKQREADRQRYMEERDVREKLYREEKEHHLCTQKSLQELLDSRSNTPINVNTNVIQVISPIQSFSAADFFFALRADPNVVPSDKEVVLSDVNRNKAILPGRGIWLMRQPEFETWFAKDSSSILVVDGREKDGYVTALSHLNVILSQGLENDPSCVTLSWFCGLHCDDEFASATEIMRNLLAQLLIHSELQFDLRKADQALLHWVERSDLDALCALLRILVTGCRTTVFILLDGISWMETQSEVKIVSMQRMLLEWRRLVGDLSTAGGVRQSGSSNLKILLASPRASEEFQQGFSEASCFEMPACISIQYGPHNDKHTEVELEAYH